MQELKSDLENPEPPIEAINNLLQHYQNGRYELAEKLAKDLIDRFPNHPFGWKVLGVLLKQSGRISQALVTNQKSVALAPDDPGAHNNLGSAFLAVGRLEEAELSYKKATTLKPDYAEAYSNLGNALQELGKLEDAEVSHRKAIALKPDFIAAYFNLGAVLQLLNRLEAAEASYRAAIKLAPDYAKAHNNLGNVLQALGRLEEAESSYRIALGWKPDYAEAHSNLGNTLQELGMLERAEISYRAAVKFAPDFAEAYSNLSLILEKLGKSQEAEKSYKKAISLSPDLAGAHSDLGFTFKKAGNLGGTIESQKRAVAFKPINTEAEYKLGMTLYGKGHYKEAAEQFRISNHKNSGTYLLKCFYRQDDQSQFYDHLDYLIDRGEINAAIGSLTARAEINYGVKKPNTFARDPFKYVLKIDLTEQYDFDNIFVQAANNFFAGNSVSYKSQAHLTNGHQTAGNLFDKNGNLFHEIEKILHAEVKKYKDHFQSSTEGFLINWPKGYSLYGWLISMKNGGKLAPHIHESGWLSGVLYIHVPPKQKTNSGNLVVCIDDEKSAREEERNPHEIVDVITGNLVLFPASLMHYTIPFESEEERIALAFDVLPD